MENGHLPPTATGTSHEEDSVAQAQVLVQPAVRSAIYRAALGTYGKACLGFLFGSKEEARAPCFAFAVTGVVMQTFEGTDYVERLKDLEALLPVAHRFAKEIDKELVGIWVAWDDTEKDETRMEALADLARSAGIGWVLEASTGGWETIWALKVFSVREAPRKQVSYRKVRRQVLRSQDNPRRIAAMWNVIIRVPRPKSGTLFSKLPS
jgi:hypothetical protein